MGERGCRRHGAGAGARHPAGGAEGSVPGSAARLGSAEGGRERRERGAISDQLLAPSRRGERPLRGSEMAEAREELLALASAGLRPRSPAQPRRPGPPPPPGLPRHPPGCGTPTPPGSPPTSPPLPPSPSPPFPTGLPDPRGLLGSSTPSASPRAPRPTPWPGSARPGPPPPKPPLSFPGRPPARLSCVPSGGRMPSVSVSCYSNPLGERSRSGSAPSSSGSRPDPPSPGGPAPPPRCPAPLRGACVPPPPPRPSPPPPLPALRKCQGSRTGRRWFPFVLLAGSPVPGRPPNPPYGAPLRPAASPPSRPRSPNRPVPRRAAERAAGSGAVGSAERPRLLRGAAAGPARGDAMRGDAVRGRPGRLQDRPSLAARPRAAAFRALSFLAPGDAPARGKGTRRISAPGTAPRSSPLIGPLSLCVFQSRPSPRQNAPNNQNQNNRAKPPSHVRALRRVLH